MNKKLDKAITSALKRVVPSRCPKAVLRNLAVSGNCIMATDCEQSLIVRLDGLESRREGLIPVKLFDSLQAWVDGKYRWPTPNSVATDTCEVGVEQIQDFPTCSMPTDDSSDSVAAQCELLDGAWDDFDWCLKAADDGSGSRYALQSLAMYRDSVCCSDGRRLHCASCIEWTGLEDAAGVFPILVPANFLFDVIPMFKLLDNMGAEIVVQAIGTTVTEDGVSTIGAPVRTVRIIATLDAVTVCWRTVLVEGRFPKVAEIVNTNASFKELPTDLEAAIKTIRNSPAFDRSECPAITFTRSGLQYKSANGKADVPINLDLESDITLDGNFMVDMIAGCQEIAVVDYKSAATFRGADGTRFGVLMPVSKG